MTNKSRPYKPPRSGSHVAKLLQQLAVGDEHEGSECDKPTETAPPTHKAATAATPILTLPYQKRSPRNIVSE